MQHCPCLFDRFLFNLKNFDGFSYPKDVDFNLVSFWVQSHNLPLGCMNRTLVNKLAR